VQVAPPVPVVAQAGAPPVREQNDAQVLTPLVVMQVDPAAQSFAALQVAPAAAWPAEPQVAPVGIR
jgi:hypothetical protein